MRFKSCSLINVLALNAVGRIDTGEKTLFLCCENVADRPGIAFQDTPEKSLECFLGMRSMVIAESIKNLGKEGTHISGCEKCVRYQSGEHVISMLISYVNLSMYPSPCQCKCFYCEVARQWRDTPEVHKAYQKLFSMLEFGKKSGIIMPNATWQISPGEITIHPYREKIMELVQGERAIFYTNCFLYDEDIAQNLHNNPNSAIDLSIDSGTPATWRRVKGVDNFEEITSNLVRYYKMSARPGQITLKYIVLPGVNDNYEDYFSLIEIMKILEVKHLTLSRDSRTKYTQTKEEQAQLLGAAAYLVAICHKNGIQNDMFAYSTEEQAEVIRLSKEVLQNHLI